MGEIVYYILAAICAFLLGAGASRVIAKRSDKAAASPIPPPVVVTNVPSKEAVKTADDAAKKTKTALDIINAKEAELKTKPPQANTPDKEVSAWLSKKSKRKAP